MRTRVFTAGVLLRDGKVLVPKRKKDDDSYPCLWDLPGGHFEAGESAEECMRREAKEETGLDVEIVRPGRLVEYADEYGRSIEIPFLLSSGSAEVIVSEHSGFRWVLPKALRRYRRVPGMDEALTDFRITTPTRIAR